MSSTFNLDLSSAIVGQAINESFVNLTGSNVQIAIENGQPPFLVLHNESRFGLTVVVQGWGLSFKLPAGGWTDPFPLPMTATGLSATPFYALPAGNVNQLAGTIYAPGDPVVRVTTLGNSPIGGSITVPNSPANSFEQDLFTAWVLTGLVSSKDISVANQLDVTAGIAFLPQADSSDGRVATSASTFLTSAPSSTYFLDLNPDGSFSFATSHSAISGHLTICSLTTDASGNILVVTDARTLNTTLLSAMLGALAVPPLLGTRGGRGILGTLVAGDAIDVDANGALYLKSAAGQPINFQTPSGATTAFMDSGGNLTLGRIKQMVGQMTAATFGVAAIVAAPSEFNITDTTLHDPLFTYNVPAQGLYRVSGSLYKHAGAATNIFIRTSYSGVHSGAEAKSTFMSVSGGGTIVEPLQGAATATLGDGEYGLYGPTMYVASGGFIHVSYQDLSGTPNDFLLLIIERLT